MRVIEVERRPLHGREVRWVVVVLLMDARRAMTIGELLDGIDRAGFALTRRPSKQLSDALRWEVRRGRVVRVSRSVYAAGRIPKSTAWWIRQRVRELGESIRPT